MTGLIKFLITPPQRISDPPLLFAQGGVGGLRNHIIVQNFEICTFPLFSALLKIFKKTDFLFEKLHFFGKMPKSPFRLPKGGLTNSGKPLLRMRDGQGVSKRKLSRECNVSLRIVRKYLNEKNPPQHTV